MISAPAFIASANGFPGFNPPATATYPPVIFFIFLISPQTDLEAEVPSFLAPPFRSSVYCDIYGYYGR